MSQHVYQIPDKPTGDISLRLYGFLIDKPTTLLSAGATSMSGCPAMYQTIAKVLFEQQWALNAVTLLRC
jgi:hypothetical protein